MSRKRTPRTFQCPKCGNVRTEPLASAVVHPCPGDNKKMVEYKEVKTADE